MSIGKRELEIFIARIGTAHYGDVIIGAIATQITSLTIVNSTVYSDTDQRKHQGSASLAFVRGSHRGPVNSPHKWPVTLKMFPFDDVIMRNQLTDPWGFGCIIKLVICVLLASVYILSISCEIALKWKSQPLTDDQSTLVQVMACCHHATN